MSDERLWKPTGRVADAAGAGQAAWAVLLLLWGGLVAVSSYAFTTIQGVMDQGWGAVFLAGLGAASAAALALAAMCFGLAGLAVGVRRIWPLPAAPPAPLPAAPLVPPLPTLADYEDTASEKRVAALERQLGDAVAFLDHARKVVDENTAAVSKIRPGLDAAIAEGKADAERAASARLDAVRKTWDHAFDQLRKRQDAFEKEVKVTLADSARDAKASVDGTIAGFGLVVKGLGERLDGLEGKIDEYAERLGGRLRDLEARAAATEEHFHRLLRLRDAVERMNELRDCLEPLADRLILAPREEFPDAKAWDAAYKEWRGRLEGFWRMASQWDPPAFDPLAVSGDDLISVEEVPGDERFKDYDSQQRYRTLIVAHRRHETYAGFAMVRIDSAAQGKP